MAMGTYKPEVQDSAFIHLLGFYLSATVRGKRKVMEVPDTQNWCSSLLCFIAWGGEMGKLTNVHQTCIAHT